MPMEPYVKKPEITMAMAYADFENYDGPGKIMQTPGGEVFLINEQGTILGPLQPGDYLIYRNNVTGRMSKREFEARYAPAPPNPGAP